MNNTIERLPEKCQKVFKLSRVDGLNNSEIANKMDVSQRTVETHISNALKVLKNSIVVVLSYIILY
ncbi:sigma-70 family RNA polymerase sigma factor [Wenyingzhuangia sp. 2_MG-2023]|uniref:sigma-70 family RNA polymerase sigma factor n=1 Tax=Wenyingzhuangia sp. 2_MG-2023 TaxID=3062639 RepID=UPI0034DEFDFB